MDVDPTDLVAMRRKIESNTCTVIAGYVINLPDAVTLGGAYDRGGASAIGLQNHVICCSGR